LLIILLFLSSSHPVNLNATLICGPTDICLLVRPLTLICGCGTDPGASSFTGGSAANSLD
jgi:hypothetical protein